MNRADMITRIRRRLGYNTGLNAAIITDAIDDAQNELEELMEKPWFLESEEATIECTPSEERVPVPSNFLSLIPEQDLYVVDNNSVRWPLTPLTTAQLRRTDQLILSNRVITGVPQFYALQGEYFRLYPVPQSNYQLKLIYYKRLVKMTADEDENDWAKHTPNSLIGKAGMIITAANGDAERYMEFEKTYTNAYAALMVASEAREHAGMQYVRGGED